MGSMEGLCAFGPPETKRPAGGRIYVGERRRWKVNVTDECSIQRKTLVVCGPTAAGKSGLADRFADRLSEEFGGWAPTLVVDSMQVYREIPFITNQVRRRPAGMVGIVSVAEDWTVARHKERIEELVARVETPFVLDAGTGMYLNAVVLDIPLAPKVPEGIREEAKRLAAGAENPRRAAREAELGLMGAGERGSIWSGRLRYDAALLYLRPPREVLDRNVAARSAKIVRDGVEEAGALTRLAPNPSVREAVGVREMLALVSGEIDAAEAEEIISARTRRLARRQMRWFDKLARHLPAGRVRVIEGAAEAGAGHDIMGVWTKQG